MINENKVKMLTKLASFEKKVHKKPDEIIRLSKAKYIARGVWWTFCAATVAFILVLVIWSFYQNNTLKVFTDFLNGKVYMFTNARLWAEYLIYIAAFIIFALFFYKRRYDKLYPEIDEYCRRKNNYEEFYNRKDVQEP